MTELRAGYRERLAALEKQLQEAQQRAHKTE
ncbi:MAG: carbohydrate porin [Pseudomonadota bacterium]